ncbi:hypothetical protein IFM89_018070 [Coptis chinensis]|uniref:RING-type domain-containing protein n=1 Tax=Coptis chinensis TaxID=261450 RepID=A0A835M2T2_9MAGN|nr:hypothetical protein IFM89_018070 [Coptis chinensis]
MDELSKKNVSNPFGNQLKESSYIVIDDDDFHISQNAATMNSRDPLNNDEGIFGVNSMPVVNLADSPECANFLDYMDGISQTHVDGMVDDNGNGMSCAPLYSDFLNPQMERSSFIIDSNMAAGVQHQSLGGVATRPSSFQAGQVNFGDTMSFSELYGNFQRPQVDINSTTNGNNAEFPEQNLRGNITATDIAGVHIVRSNANNAASVPSQLNAFHIPQGTRSNAGVQIRSQGETTIATPDIHGFSSNNEIRFPSMFNNFQSEHVIQQNSQGVAEMATSYAQSAVRNANNSMTVATQSSNFQSPQISRRSVRSRASGASAIQQNSPGKAAYATGRSHVQGFTVEGSNTNLSTLFNNNLQDQQINRAPISIDGGLASRMHAYNQDIVMDETNLSSNALLSDGIRSPLAVGNFINVGGDMPEVLQSRIHGGRNSVSTIENRSDAALCPQQIDNTFLNLGCRSNSNANFQSIELGGGISSNNGCPITNQSYASNGPQTNGNFLSLGGSLSDSSWSNNPSAVIPDFNAGLNSSTYVSLRGNMGGQTRSNRTTRNISSMNDGIHANPFTIPQAVQGNVHQHFPRPSGRALGPGGNVSGRCINTAPYGGFGGHSGMAFRPFNSIPVGLHANPQTRLSSLPQGPSSLVGIPSVPYSTHQMQQAYMNSLRHVSTNPSMVSSLNGTAVRTFGQDQSGHPVPVNDALTDAAIAITELSSIQPQSNRNTTRTSRRGKRVPAGEIPGAQPAKVLLGPSLSGKPVPVAGGVELIRTSEGLPGQTSQRSIIPNASTTLRAARGRRTPQPLVNRSTPTVSKTSPVYHLKWKDPTDLYQSSGENCHLCKRDLTFTPTGPVTQPSVPPAVAVLPCGHTFHDECLQLITPADLSKDPPCIPCAISTS